MCNSGWGGECGYKNFYNFLDGYGNNSDNGVTKFEIKEVEVFHISFKWYFYYVSNA